MPILKPGSRWQSVRDSTEVIVVRGPTQPVALGCGGSEMVAERAAAGSGPPPDEGLATATVLGKRYASEDLGIEVLCVKAGDGTLTVDGVSLPVKDSKPLPASD